MKSKEAGEADSILKLSKALTIPTVSYINTESIDYSNFSDFIKYLKKAFPLVHKNLKLELINNYSLLYRWEGSTASSDKKPALLLAHYDVVPADNPIAEHGASPSWSYPPFSGVVEEGYIWGRGALDNKTSLIGILEAAEQLISAGFSPKRTIYIASGYDEEIGGKNGPPHHPLHGGSGVSL